MELLAALATLADPRDEPDEKIRWDRVATPGGGHIDHQHVSGWVDGRRRRLLVIDYDSQDAEHARRIEAAIKMLEG